jgi:hypothetical protein
MASQTSRWIQNRAASGKPLNLNAVMRVRPDLITAAFAGPEPRGWQRSLRDAGVDPYSIVHETLESVNCPICNHKGEVLGHHLRSVHAMDTADFEAKFGPEHPLSSESFRARKFVVPPIFGIPHWERLWSRFYVIDWIIRLHEVGHDLNHYHIVLNARWLSAHGLKYWGSWDAALRAAGLDPHAARVKPVGERWSCEKIIHRLRERAASPHGSMPVALSFAVRRYFGSINAAAQAAGLCCKDLVGRRSFTKDPVE